MIRSSDSYPYRQLARRWTTIDKGLLSIIIRSHVVKYAFPVPCITRCLTSVLTSSSFLPQPRRQDVYMSLSVPSRGRQRRNTLCYGWRLVSLCRYIRPQLSPRLTSRFRQQRYRRICISRIHTISHRFQSRVRSSKGHAAEAPILDSDFSEQPTRGAH